MSGRLRATLVTVLALALPGVAAPVVHAQGAGDQQYSDPFNNGGAGSSSGGGSSGGSSSGGSGGSDSSAASGSGSSGGGSGDAAPLSSTAPSGSSATGTTTTAGGRQLPATGQDAGLIGLAGLGLLLTGAGLRLRVRPRAGEA